jgi:hypothetical protein
MAAGLEFVARGGVIPPSAHWIIEENQGATTKRTIEFLVK